MQNTPFCHITGALRHHDVRVGGSIRDYLVLNNIWCDVHAGQFQHCSTSLSKNSFKIEYISGISWRFRSYISNSHQVSGVGRVITDLASSYT